MVKKRTGKRKPKKILFFLLALTALAAVSMTAPFFNIHTITIAGTETLSCEEVLDKSGIVKGANIFRTSMKRAQKRLEEIPYIDSAVVSRKFPDIVKITVTEAKAAMCLETDKGLVITDKEGRVLEIAETNEAGVMVVWGVALSKAAKTGEVIEIADRNMSSVLTECLTALDEYELIPIMGSMNLENTVNIVMETKEGLEIRLGTTDELDYKIKLLKNILSQGYTNGIFDVGNTSQPTFRKNK